jgi:hypothetical protein
MLDGRVESAHHSEGLGMCQLMRFGGKLTNPSSAYKKQYLTFVCTGYIKMFPKSVLNRVEGGGLK